MAEVNIYGIILFMILILIAVILAFNSAQLSDIKENLAGDAFKTSETVSDDREIKDTKGKELTEGSNIQKKEVSTT